MSRLSVKEAFVYRICIIKLLRCSKNRFCEHIWLTLNCLAKFARSYCSLKTLTVVLCHAPGKWVGQLQWVWQLFIWIFIHGFYNFETKNHVRRPGYGGPEMRRLDDSNNRWLTLRSVIYNLLMPPSVMLKWSGILMSHVLIMVFWWKMAEFTVFGQWMSLHMFHTGRICIGAWMSRPHLYH